MNKPLTSAFIYSLLALFLLDTVRTVQAQSLADTAYAARIAEYTTRPEYVTDLVDHLPVSETVPSPLEYFGQIIGAPGRLHYTDEIYAYLRAVADASPRVQVRTIGYTEEDREMIEVIIADSVTMARLDTYRTYLNRLSDPRLLSTAEAQDIIAVAKPIYYLTAGLHSPETGSPEMLMEMAYRLAVEESPLIRNIRNNVITIFTPAAEPDGRDRIVDVYTYRADHDDVGPPLIYWGHYVAHDNNRDGYGLGLALTRNILGSYMHWKPTIMHDLHESVPYLYVMTGMGPYNEHVDPITIDEWHNLAFEEVSELTRKGMPGVWTHGFYNGWAANYLIWMANMRNSMGRFYETFGNSIPDTKERTLGASSTSKQWYRSKPPYEKTMWSLRNNINYMQSGVLIALNYTANHRMRHVENFYLKSSNAIQAGRTEAPYAYVIPKAQRRTLATLNLVNLLRQQGLEVHEVQGELTWTTQEAEPDSSNGSDDDTASIRTIPNGSYVVRLDQPYRSLARTLLDRQNFPAGQDPPYDDTGWTLPYLHQVETYVVNDSLILETDMNLMTQDAETETGLTGNGSTAFVLNNTTDDQVAVFRFKLPDVAMHAAESSFDIGATTFAAGSLIMNASEHDGNLADRLEPVIEELGLRVYRLDAEPNVATHPVEVPRVGLIHTWVSTPQNAGWWRLAFDKIGIPYTYLSEQDLATTDLNAFDVMIMPDTYAGTQTLIHGTTEVGEPIPWRNTPEYRHIGLIDQTDDVRRGMGYEGAQNLHTFIRNGGVFITEGTTASFPIDLGMTRRISIRQTPNLVARGSVVKADIVDPASPITYGYTDTLAVYFRQAPVFQINKNVGSYRDPDWIKDEKWNAEVPRTVVGFAKNDLLLSGMMSGETELAGTPAVVDVPVGQGHVVLFANHPFWRWETHGSHALVFNTMLHWNDLRTGWPEREED